MTWFAVDDGFHGHKKLAALESGPSFAEAIALWTVTGSWCASQLTDGDVPRGQLRKLVPFDFDRAAAELVRVELWDATDGGYQFRDWAEYQPTKEEVEAKRSAAVSRSRKYRQRAKSSVVTHDEHSDDARDVRGTYAPPVPSRPVPEERERAEPSRAMSSFMDSYGPPPNERLAHIAKRYSDAKHAAGYGRFTWDKRNHGWQFETLKSIDASIQAEADMTADQALDRALHAFFQDPDAAGDKFKLSWLSTGFGGYVAAGAKPAKADPNAAEIAALKAEFTATRKAEEESRNQGLDSKPETIRLRDHGDAVYRKIKALESESSK
jgi:hypothetical protein